MYCVEELVLGPVTPDNLDNVLEIVRTTLDKHEHNRFVLNPALRIVNETVGAFTPRRTPPRQIWGPIAGEYVVQVCFPTDLVGGHTCIDGEIYTEQAILFRKDLPYERLTILKGSQIVVQIDVLAMAKTQDPEDIKYVEIHGLKYAVPSHVAAVAKYAETEYIKTPAAFELMCKAMCGMTLQIGEMYKKDWIRDHVSILDSHDLYKHLGTTYSKLSIVVSESDYDEIPELIGFGNTRLLWHNRDKSEQFVPAYMNLGEKIVPARSLFVLINSENWLKIDPCHFHQPYVPFILQFKSGMNEIVRTGAGIISCGAIKYDHTLSIASFGHYGEIYYETTYTPMIERYGAKYSLSTPKLAYRKISTSDADDTDTDVAFQHEMFHIDSDDRLRFTEVEAAKFIKWIETTGLIEQIRLETVRRQTELNKISNAEKIHSMLAIPGYKEEDLPSVCVLNVTGYVYAA